MLRRNIDKRNFLLPAMHWKHNKKEVRTSIHEEMADYSKTRFTVAMQSRSLS
jgi:hypothetical protein